MSARKQPQKILTKSKAKGTTTTKWETPKRMNLKDQNKNKPQNSISKRKLQKNPITSKKITPKKKKQTFKSSNQSSKIKNEIKKFSSKVTNPSHRINSKIKRITGTSEDNLTIWDAWYTNSKFLYETYCAYINNCNTPYFKNL